MTVIADQAAAIAAVIDNVADSGVVYSYRPLPKSDWKDFIAGFTTTIGGVRRVRAWTVQYMGEERHEANIAIGAAKQRRWLRWKVRFYDSWDDPTSEPIFRNVLETVCDALDTSRTLGGAALDKDPVDVTIPNNGDGVLLGDYLCHTAEVDFRTLVEQNLSIV